MSFATAPNRFPICALPQLLAASKNVGIAPQNCVAPAPFYRKPASLEACASAFEFHFELVGSADGEQRIEAFANA